MKKIFLLAAFTGIVGAASAISVVSLTKSTVITVGGDEKKDDKKKGDKKACCKKGETAKGCAGEKSEAKGKACCHAKTASAAAPATPETPVKK